MPVTYCASARVCSSASNQAAKMWGNDLKSIKNSKFTKVRHDGPEHADYHLVWCHLEPQALQDCQSSFSCNIVNTI